MKARKGDYYIYRLYNERTEDEVTEFFYPDTTLENLTDRLLSIATYKTNGYKVCGLVRVDRETFFNVKVNQIVDDYCNEDRYEQELRRKLRAGEIDEDLFWDTVKLTQSFKWTCLKQLDSRIRRMCREDMDVDNEIAIQLIDQYRKALI